jgi:excisionase family DNA binding protein
MTKDNQELQLLLNQLFAGRENLRNKFEQAAARACLPFDEFIAGHFQRVADTKFLTRHQAAEQLGVGVRTIDAWIKKGMPSFKFCGTVRVNPTDLNKWIANQSSSPSTPEHRGVLHGESTGNTGVITVQKCRIRKVGQSRSSGQ